MERSYTFWFKLVIYISGAIVMVLMLVDVIPPIPIIYNPELSYETLTSINLFLSLIIVAFLAIGIILILQINFKEKWVALQKK